MARQHNVPNKNAGQVLKETAKNHGIDTSRLEHKMDSTPRSRRHKCRVPGGEISIPCLPTVNTIKEKQLIISGKLRALCSFSLHKVSHYRRRKCCI